MDNPILLLNDSVDPAASWSGYWDGINGHAPVPAATPPYMRGFRTGRIDAGLDPLDAEGAVALARYAFERYARVPA